MSGAKDVFNLPITADGDGLGSEADADLSEDDAPRAFTHYEERYVAFIDILGFTELIGLSVKEGNPQDPEPPRHHVSAIFNALDLDRTLIEDAYNSKSGSTLPGLEFSTFSDFVVVTSEPSPVGLDAITFTVWRIISDWLSKGYISRGGIAKGKVIHRGARNGRPPIVFGPAFISAYKLESEIADYPRVILSKEVREDYIAATSPPCENVIGLPSLVRKNDDGPHALDIFTHFRTNGFSLSDDQRQEALQHHKALTQNLLHGSDTPKLYRKTLWLVHQFNEAISDTRYADLKIDPNK